MIEIEKRYNNVFEKFLSSLGIGPEKCNKLNLSNVISPTPIVEAIYDENYVFNIKFYEENYYYRYLFADDNEKNRFKKLFDQDGYATITEKDKSTTQQGKSPNLFMRKGTNSNVYTIKSAGCPITKMRL